MNACVERHATTARFPRASSSPIAFSKCVFPSPLFPTSTSGLYFFPGRSSAARAAPTATWFDGPTANAASGNAADGPGGGAAPARTLAAASSASLSRSGSRNTLWPAACGSRSATSASSALSRSTSSANAVIAASTAAGASRWSSASSRWVRYPSPSHRSTASPTRADRKSTRLNSSHVETSYAVFCLKKKKKKKKKLQKKKKKKKKKEQNKQKKNK